MNKVLKFTGTQKFGGLPEDGYNNVTDLAGFKLSGEKISPKKYGEIVNRAMKNKKGWANCPIYEANMVITSASRSKGSWRSRSKK